MKVEEEGRSGKFACQMDLGRGRNLDIEVTGDNRIWTAVGAGIGVVDLWMKGVGPGLDIRVRVTRSEQGLYVSIDRGEQAVPWWPADSGPRLTLVVDPIESNASITAAIGDDEQFQEVLLGTVKL